MKLFHTYLVQFSDLVENELVHGIKLDEAYDSIEWFLSQHQSFAKLIGSEFDCYTSKGYIESLDSFLTLFDFDPVNQILIEYSVSLFMEGIKKFLKENTGKDTLRLDLGLLGDAVIIKLMS